MRTTIYKRIIGVVIIVFLFALFAPTNVNAVSEECKALKKESNKNGFWPKKYGLEINYRRGKFVVGLDKETLNQNFPKTKGNIKLCITQLYSFSIGKDGYINIKGTRNPAEGKNCINKISYSDLSDTFEAIDGNKGFGVKVVPAEGYNDPELVSKCGANSTFEMDIRINTEAVVAKAIDAGEVLALSTVDLKDPIRCSENHAAGSFEAEFCKAWRKGTEKTNPSDGTTFKCSITEDNINEIKKQYRISAKDSEYYIYKEYLKAEESYPVTGEGYEYNYTCGKVTDSNSCEVKCREAVTVEYGAPVVAKGSICYEYKVRVTSRVDCGVVHEPIPPKKKLDYCTPSPVCYSGGMSYYQGGPNDSFDACIKKCDGGKYSDKCSNKCYKEVYGTNITGMTAQRELSYVDRLQTINNNSNLQKTSDGHYYCEKGSIHWSPSGGWSRWHSANTNNWMGNLPAGYSIGDYTNVSDGIPRAYDCTDSCYWTDGSCDDPEGDYMNPGQAIEDYNANVMSYNNLINECNAYAHCKTEAAYFTIDTTVEGGQDGTHHQKIDFPYSTKEDHLVFQGKGTSENADTTIIGRNGCYKTNSDLDKIWYQGEWTFPGTWKALKGVGIRYIPPTNPSITWQKLDKQFCFERSNNVNKKFWLFITGKDSSYTKSFDNTQYFNQCIKSKFSGTGSVAAPPDVDKLRNLSNAYVTGVPESGSGSWKYNIHANTRDFGHFKWNIDINCFYAYYNCVPSPTDDDGGNPTTDYRVRTVDLKNLFPSDSGDKITDASKTGRAPGYNWSNYATNVTEKVGTYKSDPLKYVKEVQQKGYTVYSDEYLDYRIVLTKENIRAIRNDNKEYGNFDTSGYEIGDSIRYMSDLLRDKSKISEATLPDNNALKCNNIDTDHKSCKNFS